MGCATAGAAATGATTAATGGSSAGACEMGMMFERLTFGLPSAPVLIFTSAEKVVSMRF